MSKIILLTEEEALSLREEVNSPSSLEEDLGIFVFLKTLEYWTSGRPKPGSKENKKIIPNFYYGGDSAVGGLFKKIFPNFMQSTDDWGRSQVDVIWRTRNALVTNGVLEAFSYVGKKKNKKLTVSPIIEENGFKKIGRLFANGGTSGKAAASYTRINPCFKKDTEGNCIPFDIIGAFKSAAVQETIKKYINIKLLNEKLEEVYDKEVANVKDYNFGSGLFI